VIHKTRLPERPVLVTFDDGYRNVASIAAPLLERCGIPAIFFICSASVNERRLLWYDAMARRGAEAEVAGVKRLPFSEWQQVERRERTSIGDDDPLAAMTVADIRRLSSNPLFEFGGHTATHPILAAAPPAAQQEEIEGSLRCVTAWSGRRPAAFSYPKGEPKVDYTDVTVGVLHRLGVPIAFTTRAGFAGPGQSPLEQSRYMMLAGISPAELAHRLAYSWHQ
jgi:peptidoglycan/xylan/chitin deacetylase (PgdA/CDA1 family)